MIYYNIHVCIKEMEKIMLSFLCENVITKIWSALVGFLQSVGELISDLGGDPAYLFLISICLTLFVVVVALVRTAFTYEVRILRATNKMNRYFQSHPQITEDNIVEINNRFKKVPRNMRYAWQQYMLNRDSLPNKYLNTTVCVDQPIKASTHYNVSKILNIFVNIIAVVSLLLGFAYINARSGREVLPSIYLALITPAFVWVFGWLFVAFLRARYTAIVGDIYHSFHKFESYINKACSTMPSYIDYEILFTKKEIKEGIPALQEYLEKRALQEQKEKETAELQSANFEQYNFEELGIENSLLIERALVESEKYFNVKRTLGDRITTKQNEMYNYQKNFDEVTKEFERKAQAVRENLKQLNEQLNNTSVNIEANYIKKRYKEEQQKLQQLEKDYELASIRFNKQQSDMSKEIDALNAEIADKKDELQRAMTEEGKSYANKIFGLINDKITEQNKPILESQKQELENMKQQLESMHSAVEEKENSINELNQKIQNLDEELLVKKSEIEGIKNLKEYLISPDFRQRVVDKKKRRLSDDEVIENLNVEELKTRATQAEEELRVANERQKQLEQQENQLIVKLRLLEESEKRLQQENTKLQDEAAKAENDKIAKVQKDLELLNQKIFQENKNLAENQEALMGKIEKTLQNAENKRTVKTNSSRKSSLKDLVVKAQKLPKNKK